MPIVSTTEVEPCPATAPARTTTVSPGATNPTNAPVSRKASRPTIRYVHDPSEPDASSSSFCASMSGSARLINW